MKDNFERKIDYLRISVTDRCNLNCSYCITQDVKFLPHSEILTFEEIVKIAEAAVKIGITKIRLTGGEPLIRKDIVELVRKLARLSGIKDISLTTNGQLLSSLAKDLKEAGLRRINISLDTLNPESYRLITGGGSLEKVLEGIDRAIEVGMDPVKVNAVLTGDYIDSELDSFIDLVYRKKVHVRFIEKMEFDDNKCGSTEGIDCQQIKQKISEKIRIEETEGPYGFGPAKYIKPEGALGTIGFICPYSRHFCSECNRLRITADGAVRPCLFSDLEVDLKDVLRASHYSEEKLIERLKEALSMKPESFKKAVRLNKRIMRQIGG